MRFPGEDRMIEELLAVRGPKDSATDMHVKPSQKRASTNLSRGELKLCESAYKAARECKRISVRVAGHLLEALTHVFVMQRVVNARATALGAREFDPLDASWLEMPIKVLDFERVADARILAYITEKRLE
jgi:hypothetical protein